MLSTATPETQPDSHADGEVPVDRERLEYVTRAVNSPTLLMVGTGTVVFLLGRIERQNQCFDLSVLIAFAFIAGLAVWYPGVRQSELWRVLNAGGLWLSFIAWGLFFHIRLTLLLPKRVSEHDDE